MKMEIGNENCGIINFSLTWGRWESMNRSENKLLRRASGFMG